MTTHSERYRQARELGERLLLSLTFIERVQDFPSGAQFRGIVQAEMDRGRLRALQLVSRDVEEMILTLTPSERDGLDALLQARIGVETESTWRTEQEAIRGAIAAGRIRDEHERQRIERYVEALEVRGGDAVEITAARNLLAQG